MNPPAVPLLSPVAELVLVTALGAALALAVILPVFMPRVLAIVRRDLAAFFLSPVAYVTMIFYAILGGNSFFASVPIMWQEDEPSLAHAFVGLLSATLLVAPVLTMRLLAEERERGTLESLLTTVTTPFEIMLGKYLAAMALYLSLLSIALVYYLAVVRCLAADIDHGQVLAGFIGMTAFGSGLVAIGLMVSAFCRNAMSAVVITLALFFGLLFLDTGISRIQQFVAGIVATIAPIDNADALGERAGELIAEGLRFVSLNAHLSSFLSGRLDMRDLSYHASVTVFCLTLVLMAINSRRN